MIVELPIHYCSLLPLNGDVTKNSIHATGLCVGNITAYSTITYGDKIVAPAKKSTSGGCTIRWKEINSSETPGSYVMITTTLKDLQALIDEKNIIVIDSSEGSQKDRAHNDKSRLSGIILLAVMKFSRKKRKIGWNWGQSHFNLASRCKPNINNAASRHKESYGLYYSFVNRANYGMKGNSSITQYTHIKKKEDKSKLSTMVTEEMVEAELNQFINSINNLIPMLSKVISPIIGTAYEMQQSQTVYCK